MVVILEQTGQGGDGKLRAEVLEHTGGGHGHLQLAELAHLGGGQLVAQDRARIDGNLHAAVGLLVGQLGEQVQGLVKVVAIGLGRGQTDLIDLIAAAGGSGGGLAAGGSGGTAAAAGSQAEDHRQGHERSKSLQEMLFHKCVPLCCFFNRTHNAG
ncbi:hypothetical protein SDC9_113965 [bioreactor metagenome]|uniref:Uncharacterized protein n=1 Tax=bioreactor metagenome TaxID=1076179 RepID=A0A645BNK9_9ZZZZ